MEPDCNSVLLRLLWSSRCPRLIVLSYLKQCSGKSVSEQENEPAKPSVNLEELRAEIKAKIEEEAYQKGWGPLFCFLV